MGWEQLRAIYDENRSQARREAAEPPVACPLDGAILNINPRGDRSCPLGNYTWTGGVPLNPASV